MRMSSEDLDFSNSLLYGIPGYQVQKLQIVQNAAAKLIYNAGKFDHVTPLLRELHWLPIRKRIFYKVLLFVFNVLHGKAPIYLSELISEYMPQRSLR